MFLNSDCYGAFRIESHAHFFCGTIKTSIWQQTPLLVSMCLLILFAKCANGHEFDLLGAEDTAKPNFVWLISEDNSKHYMKLFDVNGCETANIRQLANSGIVFDRAFSNAPVCSVARTTLFTGCYAPRIGAQFHRKQLSVPLPDGTKMFPALLREAGYYVTNNSKKDFNVIEGDGVWDESSKTASWRNRKQGQPFFHVQSFNQSHESSLHFSRKKMLFEKTRSDASSVFISPLHPQTDLFRYNVARYQDRIKLIDDEVGNVVEQLRNDDLLEDTFVFYFSDHGGVLPASKGYLFETGLHVPLVIRIPNKFEHLVGRNWIRGLRTKMFVSFVDFGETLLSLANVDSNFGTDGLAFLDESIDFENIARSRNSVIGYADRFDEKFDLVRSIRVGPYKYIRNFQPLRFDGLQNNYRFKNLAFQEWRNLYRAGALKETQARFFEKKPAEALFNIDEDPYETKNLADDADWNSKLIELRERLTNKLKSMPDLGFYPESYLIENAFDNPVRFGQQNQLHIATLVDIANLCLQDFDAVKNRLEKHLRSENTWCRYWAIQACSAFGKQAVMKTTLIRNIATKDHEPLNRVAAAEFIATTSNVEDNWLQSVFEASIADCQSKVAAAMILNSVVLLNDGYDKRIIVSRDWFAKWQTSNRDILELRLNYLLKNKMK